MTTEPDAVRLSGDLGRIPTLQIRWRARRTQIRTARAQRKGALRVGPANCPATSWSVALSSRSRIGDDAVHRCARRVGSSPSLRFVARERCVNRLRDWGIEQGPKARALRPCRHLATSVQVFVELLSRKYWRLPRLFWPTHTHSGCQQRRHLGLSFGPA